MTHSCKCISQKDFKCRVNGIKITKSGKYKFKEDIVFSPTQENKAAITICASNVTLDLCQKVLKQGNTERQTIGVRVKTGHCNIKIINGTISNFSTKGLLVEGGTSSIILGEAHSFLKLFENGRGSTFSYRDDVTGESILQNGLQLGLSRVDEILGFGEYLGTITDIRMDNVLCKKNSPIGCKLGDVNGLRAENCSFSQNLGYRIAGNEPPFGSDDSFTAFGVQFVSTESVGDRFNDIVFKNCNFDEQLIEEDPENPFGRLESYVSGLNGGVSFTGLKCIGCTFNRNRNETIGTADFSYGTGPFFCGGGDHFLFQDCDILDNFSRHTFECHVSASYFKPDIELTIEPTSALEIVNCTFARNIIDTPPDLGVDPQLRGVRLVYNNSLRVSGCEFSENKAIVSDNFRATVIGIELLGQSTSFIDSPQQNSLIENNIFAQNSTNSTDSGTLIAGILVGDQTENVNIRDNYISQNRSLLESGDASVNGIVVNGSNPSAEVEVGGEKYNAVFTIFGPPSTWPNPSISDQGQLTDPSGACSGPLADLTGKIGIIEFDACGPSPSGVRVLRVEDANAMGTLIISDDENPAFGGSASQEKVAVVVTKSDGDLILEYLAENPNAEISITTLQSPRSGVVIQRNTIQDHTSTGILDLFGLEDTICNNIIDKCGSGILFTGRAMCANVQENKISNASEVGIRDEAEESTNLVVQNRIWNSASGIDVTYPSGPAPTQTGSLVSGLPTNVGALDNIVIVKSESEERSVELKKRRTISPPMEKKFDKSFKDACEAFLKSRKHGSGWNILNEIHK